MKAIKQITLLTLKGRKKGRKEERKKERKIINLNEIDKIILLKNDNTMKIKFYIHDLNIA